jgi:protein transport protein SEC24
VLASEIGLEAVIRVRASRGLRMKAFHGNFFIRSTDLLSLPAVPVDQSYSIEVELEDNIATPMAYMQCAVLHTTCYGERRIRVITLALPTTDNVSNLFASADQTAIATLLACKAVEKTMSAKLEDAREFVNKQLVDMLGAYKAATQAGGSGASTALAVPHNLRFLPLLVLGLLKNVRPAPSAALITLPSLHLGNADADQPPFTSPRSACARARRSCPTCGATPRRC